MARNTVRDKVHKAVWGVAQSIASGTYENDTPMPIYAEREAGLTPVVHRKQVAELSNQSMRVIDDTLTTLGHSSILEHTTGPFYNAGGHRNYGRSDYFGGDDIRAGYTFVIDFPRYTMKQWPEKHRPSKDLQKATAVLRQKLGR
jgi:hypothetical protein